MVRDVRAVNGASTLVHLVAANSPDGEKELTVLSPPDAIIPCPSQSLTFDVNAIEPLAAWQRNHRLLELTAQKGSSLFQGVYAGRVLLHSYQLAPVKKLLSKVRPSILIADDVGLGKTVEAGLCLLELMARRRADRILIVVPPGLLTQWQEELSVKFGLSFSMIEDGSGFAREQTNLPAGINPWDALPRILTSMEYLKKEEVRRRALRRTWDVVVVDEAHALAQSGTGVNPYNTQRTDLGKTLRDSSRSLILLTATPHNGFAHSFRSLIELVEPTYATFEGTEEDRRRRIEAARIRRLKSQIRHKTKTGGWEPVFPPRKVTPIPVPLSPVEKQLFDKVSTYCARTIKDAAGTEDEDLVSFAMQIVKKRMLSSRRALISTVEHRLQSLERPEEREEPPERAEIRDLRTDLPMNEERLERLSQRIVQSVVSKDEKIQKSEIRKLKEIRKLIKSCPPDDPKMVTALQYVRQTLSSDSSAKIIVFTEYVDTLESLKDALSSDSRLSKSFAVLRGGMSIRRRRRVQDMFESSDIRLMLATDAASEGLNLQKSCHRILHVELPWNPNRLEQRNGRIDRYGQTRPPDIRYLWFPDSPEDDMLHLIVRKIEEMHKERISTPDILGVLAGSDFLESGMVKLDAEESDAAEQKKMLVKLFDERVEEYESNLHPLLGVGRVGGNDDQYDATPILLADDLELESLLLAVLNRDGEYMKPCKSAPEGVYRIEVPAKFRGSSVSPAYASATCRRSLAVQERPDRLEFITPQHPLVQSLASLARRTLLQVYEDEGRSPKRLAARIVPRDEPPSILFTFYSQCVGVDLLEEQIQPVRIGLDGRQIGTVEEACAVLCSSESPGEIPMEILRRDFENPFAKLYLRAEEWMTGWAARRLKELQTEREKIADILESELEADAQARRREIEDAERRAKGLMDESQPALFGRTVSDIYRAEPVKGARLAAVTTFVNQRKVEIAEYRRVEMPHPPNPLGALFLMPAATSKK